MMGVVVGVGDEQRVVRPRSESGSSNASWDRPPPTPETPTSTAAMIMPPCALSMGRRSLSRSSTSSRLAPSHSLSAAQMSQHQLHPISHIQHHRWTMDRTAAPGTNRGKKRPRHGLLSLRTSAIPEESSPSAPSSATRNSLLRQRSPTTPTPGYTLVSYNPHTPTAPEITIPRRSEDSALPKYDGPSDDFLRSMGIDVPPRTILSRGPFGMTNLRAGTALVAAYTLLSDLASLLMAATGLIPNTFASDRLAGGTSAMFGIVNWTIIVMSVVFAILDIVGVTGSVRCSVTRVTVYGGSLWRILLFNHASVGVLLYGDFARAWQVALVTLTVMLHSYLCVCVWSFRIDLVCCPSHYHFVETTWGGLFSASGAQQHQQQPSMTSVDGDGFDNDTYGSRVIMQHVVGQAPTPHVNVTGGAQESSESSDDEIITVERTDRPPTLTVTFDTSELDLSWDSPT